MKRRIVVTGGAGFIGSHLCKALVAAGHEVVALDNLLTGEASNLAGLSKHPRFTFLQQDVTKAFSLEGRVDEVYHLASPASPRDYLDHWMETLMVGAVGTRHALEFARAKGARFLLTSTSEVYGDPEVHPQPETYWGHVNPIGPRAVYDEAKRFAEALTMAMRRYHRLETRIARIFNTYGPRMRPNDGRAIPNFFSQALRGEPLTVYGDGSQTRSFCYVDDLVRGLMLLMEKGDGMPVNLGNPQEMSILELAKRIQKLSGSSSKIVFEPLPQDDPKQRKPDVRRAKELLGWEPRIDFDQGIRMTFQALRAPSSRVTA